MNGPHGRPPTRVLKGCAAAVAALFLLAAPTAVQAQWWEDEEAYGTSEDRGFTDYGYYDDYGYGTDDQAGLYGDQYGYGYDERFNDDEVGLGEEDGIVGEDAGLDEGDLATQGLYDEGPWGDGYYDEDFEGDAWFD